MVNKPFLERFLQRPHWFQETQFVNYDDSLQMQAKLGSFSLEVKWVGAYVYTLGCIEEKNRGRSIMGWLRPMWVWPCLPGLSAPFSPENPMNCPRWLLPLVYSPMEDFCSTFSWRKTACHCGFVVDPTNCLCFSQLWNTTKSNRVGRWLLSGKRATSLSTTVGRGNSIYALGPAPVYAFFFETHTLTDTHTLVNPIKVRSWLSALHSKYIQVSHERDT